MRSASLLALGIGAALLVVATAPLAAADTRPSWIPPDGPAGPVETLGAIASGAYPANRPVTTQTVTIASLSCPSCDDATTPADFWVKDASGAQVQVHVPNTWQPTWNVKKQNFVPMVGMQVVVQGYTGSVNGQHMITLKRFGELGHPGPTAHAYDVAAGKYPSGTYVWLAPVKILNRGFWDDGDHSWDARDPAGGGLVHIELSPAYAGQIHLPNVGDTVTPYGQVRFDPDHNWWELHPVRCWSVSECVPTSAAYVQNGPPAGTPATTSTSTGYYEQGGPVPLWVPLASGSGTGTNQGQFGATFSPSGNNWWVQTLVASTASIIGVDAQVNGGAWTSLAWQSWGGWAKSFYVPTGASVVFRAHASDGSLATSPAYTWPPNENPGTATAGGGASSGGTAAWATFHPQNGNAWWVQTSVTSSKTLAGVDARVNGGAWVTLTKYGWGWAKSMSAPAGSQVQFRARATDGDSVVSGSYAWPQ